MAGFFKKVWNCFTESIVSIWENIKEFVIVMLVIMIAGYIAQYYFSLGQFIGFESNIREEAMRISVMRHNALVVFLGVFGSCLAIWARIDYRKQLKYTREQLEITRSINRNDRFAKASEMLGNDESFASQGGGLYMLRDLVREKPKKEYIRCAEIVCYWLKGNDRNLSLRQLATEIFTTEAIENLSDETRRNLIEKHKKEHGRELWPDLAGANLKNLTLSRLDLQSAFLHKTQFAPSSLREANLQNAYMVSANMEGAYLHGADFSRAFIADAKMKNAKGLKPEQIIKSTWKQKEENVIHGIVPELPDDLMNDPDVQDWLKNPPFIYELKP